MRYLTTLVCSTATFLALIGLAPLSGQEAKQAGPLEFRLIAKQNVYTWDGGGKTPQEFKKLLQEYEKAIKKQGATKEPPKAPQVDLTLQIVNVGKETVTVYLGGDVNVYTFDLKGPGAYAVRNNAAFTLELRMPKPRQLKPGESVDIPIKRLMDGHRGTGRLLYWTEPGEYQLSASYTLSNPKGTKGVVLQSAPVKLKVEMKK